MHAHTLSYLRRLCREREGPSQCLGDLLDMRFLNTVLVVREMDEESVLELRDRWIDEPCGEALPALIWALCTDPRWVVKKAGYELSLEADWIGRNRLMWGHSQRSAS